ncbi:tetratricopeptide repeat protein [Thalassotalea euphylliae]|uniref:Tetratricopeptide repeat protein n=1 Tax=Thalassotalea euphylliae TaxID=1655234 RepID=A0A3E0TV20_9GAMM|nr:tetratricopeptide repeat protein [Thalassotalea euphylliae]REL28511.1 tetratricopeptide repeat protein [Thalassotalea euphylliae]
MSGQDADTGSHNKNRARGVKASPLKLRAALNAKGLKSQAEVAEAIRQQEGLAKPPRTLVGRVFRSEAVDPVSIERVARVLDVEAWNLYLDSSEKALISSNASQDFNTKKTSASTADERENIGHMATNKPPIFSATDKFPHTQEAIAQQGDNLQGKAIKGWVVLCFVAVILVASYLYHTIYRVEETLPVKSPAIDFSNKVLVVLPFEGPRGADISNMLHQVLNEASHWVSASSLYQSTASPLDLISQQQSDLVFSGKVKQIGRHILLQIFVSELETTRQVWAETFVKSASNQYLKQQIAAWFEAYMQQTSPPVFPSGAILLRYLNAKTYMQQDRSTHVLLKTLTELQSVARLAPDFAKGHADLCASLVEYSKLSGDQAKLTEAELHCQTAEKLAPDQVSTVTANAYLSRSKGELKQALQQIERALAIAPDHIDAIRAKAEMQMRVYLKSREPQLFTEIERELERAATIEQDNWKVPFTLARLYYFAGKQQLAVVQFKQANQLYPSYQTHSNLGTLEFCLGNLAAARTHYQQALNYSPNEQTLLSNIATLHHYLGDYEKALAIYQPQLTALKRDGADHLYQVWANIGDAHRMLGQTAESIAAYRQALLTLEQEIAKGEDTIQHQTARLALYLLHAELEPTAYSANFLATLEQQAHQYQQVGDPVSLFYMANTWRMLGDIAQAKRLRDQLGASCPGYVASPDLRQLDQL